MAKTSETRRPGEGSRASDHQREGTTPMAKGQRISKPYEYHGLTPRGAPPPRIYRIWQDMRGRCYDRNDKRYADYGGRGITVCERWRASVVAFIEDVGLPPSLDYSLNRINNDGNYEPGNVNWASRTEQARNTRRNKLTMQTARAIRILRKHEGFTLDLLAEMLHLNRNTIYNVISGKQWKE